MKKIIILGGGEIGRPGFPVETTTIDKETIRLSGKKRPRLLFIPTASSDADVYVKTVKKHFGNKLSCNIQTLYTIKHKIRPTEIKKMILSADIIYVGGGDTLKMMNIWRKNGIDKLLIQAAKKGAVLSGVSAGAICWFKYGHSDSQKFSNRKSPFIKVSGLNLYPFLICPHYDSEPARKKSLKIIMQKTKEVAIALDNCSALEIINDKYRIIKSKKQANAYRCYWSKNIYHEELIKKSTTFQPITKLSQK